jgi:hypothetical protein
MHDGHSAAIEARLAAVRRTAVVRLRREIEPLGIMSPLAPRRRDDVRLKVVGSLEM